MKLSLAFVFIAALGPRSAVYVKGHSHAADKVRTDLESLTCYRSATQPETSDDTLVVDHLLARSSGRRWIVLLLLDHRQQVLWKAKAEEYPWPIPYPLGRMLKKMAKSTCPGDAGGGAQPASGQQSRKSFAASGSPKGALPQYREK